MHKVKKIWRRIRKTVSVGWLMVGVCVVALVLWQLLKPAELLPRHTLNKGVVERVVFASGRVEVSDQVNLSFQESGVISTVAVRSGDRVKKGQLLARLDLGTLTADLRDARASLTEAEYKKSRSELNASLSTNTLTADAANAAANLEVLRVKLLSSDLILTPDASTITSGVETPLVSGTYNGLGEEVQFEVTLYASSGPSGLSARIRGAGVNDTIALSDSFPTEIGKTGLYIQLPDNISGLSETKWILHLPNTRSSQYASNLYQFLEAKKSYEAALKNQSKEITLITKGYNGLTEYDIAIERARASVDRVNQLIRLRGLYSPVDGVVGRVDLKVGQSVSQGADVVTVLGKGKLQTKLKVPESSIGGIQLNDPVVVAPDIDATDMYDGVIASIDQAESYVDGTPVYETIVVINDAKNLKPGMTVRGKITTDKIASTFRVPELALFATNDGEQIIKQYTSSDKNDTVDIPVVVKLKGTDGLYAVEGELQEGVEIKLRSE